ncbi:MAG TPA: ethylbenzene dehydrogenase-related protein [Planctomycetota bacterium]
MKQRHLFQRGFAVWILSSAGAAARRAAAAAAPRPDGGANDRGYLLYAQNCSVCHGERGRGDGPAAHLLSPKPRDFGSGRFRIVSTATRAPSVTDLMGTLRRGMPGSAMPSWNHLEDEDLFALVEVVRELAVNGIVVDLQREADRKGQDLTPEQAREIALTEMDPGIDFELPHPRFRSTVGLERGRRLFLRHCADCHGREGRASSVRRQWNEDGTETRPRDFTAGIFKGGSGHDALLRRILIGMPGSPMPAGVFERDEDASYLASYVASLVRPGNEARSVQTRRSLPVRRVEGAVPLAPDAAEWDAVPAEFLPLMPLWWRQDRVEGVLWRAVHDGGRLAIRLSWEDRYEDRSVLSARGYSDAAALQFSAAPDPPLLAMGTAEQPVSIWHWKAAWEIWPRIGGGVPHVAEKLHARGFGVMEATTSGGDEIYAKGSWAAGYWDLVFVRDLRAADAESIELAPGSNACVGVAVWDGFAGDRNGQKSVTIWHDLLIER